MIYDLHNDLLSHLEVHPYNSIFDAETRSSVIHLKEGKVAFEALVLSTLTLPGSSRKGMRQLKLFQQLAKRYPEYFSYVKNSRKSIGSIVQVRLAIENASSIAEEDEPIDKVLKRLDTICAEVEIPLYMSLTWNFENRFGGGARTSCGLKSDGKLLLDCMAHYGIACDLSHASDELARNIFSYIDKKDLQLFVIASHSNFRKLWDVPRNLPCDIAKEIITREGYIFLNVIRQFVGETSDAFCSHVAHAQENGWIEQIGIGADFFSTQSIPKQHRTFKEKLFFDDIETAAQLSTVKNKLQKEFGVDIAEKVCYKNARRFVEGRPF